MLRSRQEKEQLVRKFEEIAPILKNYNVFGWIVSECDKDPLYKVYPEMETVPYDFRPFEINVKTGWHSEIIYRDRLGMHRIPEGTNPPEVNEWQDYCYKACCASAIIRAKE